MLDLAFDGSDSVAVTHMVTVCKDASVRLWDINGELFCQQLVVVILVLTMTCVTLCACVPQVRYVVSEDPKMLKTFNASEQKPYESVDLSPNSKVRTQQQQNLFGWL